MSESLKNATVSHARITPEEIAKTRSLIHEYTAKPAKALVQVAELQEKAYANARGIINECIRNVVVANPSTQSAVLPGKLLSQTFVWDKMHDELRANGFKVVVETEPVRKIQVMW